MPVASCVVGKQNPRHWPYGCLVVLPQDLQVEQRISVINLVSSQASPAVIVWRGHEGAEGWELGIELINPEMGFWGVDL